MSCAHKQLFNRLIKQIIPICFISDLKMVPIVKCDFQQGETEMNRLLIKCLIKYTKQLQSFLDAGD